MAGVDCVSFRGMVKKIKIVQSSWGKFQEDNFWFFVEESSQQKWVGNKSFLKV